MPRYTEYNVDDIYKLANSFLIDCLQKNGSLLFHGESLWNLDVLQRLHSAFVASPDETGGTFIPKLKGQISRSGKDVIRLAAEVLCVYFLFPSSVGGARKTEVVNEVLSWNNESLQENNKFISSAFDMGGIGSTGRGYNTRRPFEIGFLIEFAIVFKKLSEKEQSEVAVDPRRFQNIVDSVEGAESRQLRHILLHLLFPDSFERIASGNHKRRVVKAFSGLIKSATELDEDSAILVIRKELEKLLKKDFDFYRAPIVEAWNDGAEGEDDEVPLEIIQHKKQIVLYGPPGTGKTFLAKILAKRVIRSAALRQMGAARYFQSDAVIEAAIKTNIHRLQLHPAYSYEDFIRALHISSEGGTEYRTGYLPNLIKDIEELARNDSEGQSDVIKLPHVLILDEMNRTDLSRMFGECFSLLEDRNQTIELPGRDKNGDAMTLCIPDNLFVIGTMNLIDQSIEQIDFALRRRFLWRLCAFDEDALVSAAKVKWNELKSELEWDRIETDFRKLAATASALNKEIHNSSLLGAQYEIGHTYFLDVVVFLQNFLGLKPARKQIYLWNKKGEALEPVILVWNLSLRPLLEQYLAGLEANSRHTELDRLSKVLMKSVVTE